MRKTLKVVAFGGGPADAFIKAAGITDSTQQTAIKTLVNDLNGYGLWSKMKAIYPMVGGNATAHSYNLKDTTKFKITWNGGITHDSNGVLGNGTNGYADTSLRHGIDFLATNYGQGHYINNDTNTLGPDFGANTNTNVSFARNSGSFYSKGLESSLSYIIISIPDSKRFYHRYNGSGVSSIFFNSSKQYSGTGISAFDTSAAYNFLGVSGWAFGNKRFAFSFVSEYLNDTEAANLYTSIQKFQTTLNRFVGTPIYPSFDSDAQSFMTSASITDSTQQAAVNYLVTDLKSNNLWTKMKAVYPMVGGTATSHSYNLKNPSQFQIAFSGGWTHSSNGALPNGTNGYGDTGLNASTQLTTPSHLSYYTKTNGNTGIDQIDIGITNFWLSLWYAGSGFNNLLARNQSSTVLLNGGTVTNSQGFGITTKISNTSKIFFNNIQKDSQTDTTNIYTNNNIYIGAFNNGSPALWSNRQCAFATIGDGLTDTDTSKLYTIIQNYQTILSRNI